MSAPRSLASWLCHGQIGAGEGRRSLSRVLSRLLLPAGDLFEGSLRVTEEMRRVLRRLAEHFSPPGVHRLDTPFDVPGLDFESQVRPALRRLTSADPPYIGGVSVAEMDYPVVVTSLTERGWQAAEVAGDARDASPGAPASARPARAVTATERPFQVALSFAGEQRDYVHRVASGLAAAGVTYYYDLEQEVRTLGRDLIEEFARVYQDEAVVVAMFISGEYAEKSWPRQERRAALARALQERREYVLPFRFDDTPLEGLLPTVGYISIGTRTPEEVAGIIAEKLVLLGGALPATRGPQLGWARATSGRSSSDLQVTVVDETGAPLAGAHVLAVAANGTYVSAQTDGQAVAILRLPAQRIVTVFAAHLEAAPALVRGHDPVEDLQITLPRADGVGGLIIERGTGYVPGLDGRLNPIRDTSNRLYLYADNIAIDDAASQPRTFELGQPLALEDAHGARVVLTIIDVIGRSSLLRFER